jgi:hypothetical protein
MGDEACEESVTVRRVSMETAGSMSPAMPASLPEELSRRLNEPVRRMRAVLTGAGLAPVR